MPVVGFGGLATEVGRGGGLDGVVLVEQGSSYGTGALLADSRHILTAAHVVDSSSGGKTITFQMARGSTAIDIAINIPAGSALLDSSWVSGGPANQGNDLALLTLVDQVQQQASRQLVAPFGAERYSFWDGNVAGDVVTMVGFGRTGTGADGNHLDEVQRVTVPNPTSGGTFTLTFKGQTTAPIAQNANAAQVQAALTALSTVGASNVEVSDRGLPTGTWDVRFLRGLGNQDVEDMTASAGVEVVEVFAGGSSEMSRIKREGQNEIDRVDGQFLSYDFDDGSPAHNTWGSLGLGQREAGLERGDSGSPLLVENAGAYAIAGVFSWISTGGDRDYNNFATPDGSFGGTGTYISTKSRMDGFLAPNLGGDYHLVLDMNQQVLGLDGMVENLTIRASRDGGDLVLNVYGSSDMSLNGEYYRAPIAGPGGRILSLTLRGSDDNETFVVDGDLGLGSVTVDGRAGTDTLELDNAASNSWKVTGKNQGTVSTNTLTFKDIENIKGGSGADVVSFAAGGQITGNVDGGDGSDRLDYGGFGAAVLTRIVTVPYGGGSYQPPFAYTFAGTSTGIGGQFLNFEGEAGSAQRDTLKYDGSSGTWWSLTAPNAGNVNGFVFSSMENLGGGRSDDRFVFGAGSAVSGSIDGSDGRDTLDFSGFNAPVTLDLRAGALPGGGSFTNIEGVVGGSQVDTLIAGDTTNTWTITGPNQGDLNGAFSFLGMEQLTGGSRRDIFVFAPGGWLNGRLTGGGGSDWLDYRNAGPFMNVDLSRGVAAKTGGVAGIENVQGSTDGFDRLVGDNLNNILIAYNSSNYVHGLGGRDLIVGGLGRNTVIGGVGDDIAVGGWTLYDGNLDALEALMAEWSRALAYNVRVNDLLTGRGLAAGYFLRSGVTMFYQSPPPPVPTPDPGGGPAPPPKAPPVVLVQSKVYGSLGFDFFGVRFVSSALDFDRLHERRA